MVPLLVEQLNSRLDIYVRIIFKLHTSNGKIIYFHVSGRARVIVIHSIIVWDLVVSLD